MPISYTLKNDALSFQMLPKQTISQVTGNESQVICLGEDHANIFHRRWVYNSLEGLRDQHYKILAMEMPFDLQKKIDYLLKRSERSADNVKNYFLPWSFKQNPLSDTTCAMSYYKVLHRANQLGMKVKLVDASFKSLEFNIQDPINTKSVTYRNKFMAQKISTLGDEKIILLGGAAHMYGAPLAVAGENSVQSELQKFGIKTYTLNMLSTNEQIIGKDCYDFDFISERDPVTAKAIRKDFFKNLKTIQKDKPVEFDLHKLSELAGKEIPDKLILFSQSSSDLQEKFNLRTNYSANSYAEFYLWEMIEKREFLHRNKIT